MSFQHTVTHSVRAGGHEVAQSNVYTGESETSLDAPIPDSSTDKLVDFALDVSQIQSILILSDHDITLETNDGAAPDDTLNLVANKPYIWTIDSYDDLKFTEDITALYVTNASGAAAQLQIVVVFDATP